MKKLFIIFFLIPPIFLIIHSVAGLWRFPNIIPEDINLRIINFILRNYRSITLSLISSILFSLSTVVLSFIFTFLPASLLARYEFRGRFIVESLLLSPALIPAITFSMGIHWIFIKLGISDTYIGVILVLTMFSYPYMLRSLTSGFMMYNKLYDICAENLGAGLVSRVIKIHLPLLMPSIVSGGTVVFLSSFSSYFLVFLIGGGKVISFTGYLVPFLKAEDWNISSFLSLVFLIIPLLLFITVDKFVRRYSHEKAF